MVNRIREEREKQNLTQSELAEKSGISRVTISELENGSRRATSSKTLFALAKALNTTINQLFFAESV